MSEQKDIAKAATVEATEDLLALVRKIVAKNVVGLEGDIDCLKIEIMDLRPKLPYLIRLLTIKDDSWMPKESSRTEIIIDIGTPAGTSKEATPKQSFLEKLKSRIPTAAQSVEPSAVPTPIITPKPSSKPPRYSRACQKSAPPRPTYDTTPIQTDSEHNPNIWYCRCSLGQVKNLK